MRVVQATLVKAPKVVVVPPKAIQAEVALLQATLALFPPISTLTSIPTLTSPQAVIN